MKNNISIPKKVTNLYTSYTLNPQLRNLSIDFTLCYCLFGFLKLNKNASLDNYKYSDCSIGFNSGSELLFTYGIMGGNVLIFVAGMSSSVHIHNKEKDISFLGEGPIQD